jgi:hypothetical protein
VGSPDHIRQPAEVNHSGRVASGLAHPGCPTGLVSASSVAEKWPRIGGRRLVQPLHCPAA